MRPVREWRIRFWFRTGMLILCTLAVVIFLAEPQWILLLAAVVFELGTLAYWLWLPVRVRSFDDGHVELKQLGRKPRRFEIGSTHVHELHQSGLVGTLWFLRLMDSRGGGRVVVSLAEYRRRDRQELASAVKALGHRRTR